MSAEKLVQILVRDIPKDLVTTVETMLVQAVEKAREPAKGLDKGHRASVEGQFRHALCNEAFAAALKECGVEHTPIRGCQIVVGARDAARYARLHVNSGPSFNNVSKSKSKRALAARNMDLGLFIQPDILRPDPLPEFPAVSVFFVTRCGQSIEETVVEIVVTDKSMDMRNPVFRKTVAEFLPYYNQAQQPLDNAHPKLKPIKKRQDDKGAS